MWTGNVSVYTVHHIEKASVNLNCIWLTCLQVVQELVWLVATFLRYSNASVVVWRIVGWYLILLLIMWLISVVSFHFQPLRVIVMYKCTQQNTGYDVAVQFVCPSVCHTCVLCVNGKMCCLVGLGAPLLFFYLAWKTSLKCWWICLRLWRCKHTQKLSVWSLWFSTEV